MAFVGPGIDTNLLAGRNFDDAIAELGYDRFILDGNGDRVLCRLWKRGEENHSISVYAADVIHAAHAAINAAKTYSELTSIND